jgi:hypothetical protein
MTTYRSFFYVLGSFILFFSSCTDKKRNIKSYYFPIEHLYEGKVYQYDVKIDEKSMPEYWYVHAEEQNGKQYLFTSRYDQDFNIRHLVSEEVVFNGTLVSKYFLYDIDASGKNIPIPVQVPQNNLFPFEVTDSTGVFIFEANWTSPKDTTQKTTVIKNRRFKGDSDFLFQEKNQPCITFSTHDLVEDKREGTLALEQKGIEKYAKNMGLVYLKKNIGKNTLSYTLIDTFGMPELEKRMKAYWEKKQ